MSSLPFYFLFFMIPSILAVQVHPLARSPTSNATCDESVYGWMNNTQNSSPCVVVAYVEAACYGNTFVQPALQPGQSYATPNSTNQTPCYCSWSSYNLLMACTYCQGSSFIWTWGNWSSGCNPSWTTQYFPPGLPLAGNQSIPHWASLDPAKWTYETFNIPDALSAYQKNSSSIIPGATPSTTSDASPSSSGSKIDVGAVVGVTIGSAAALALLAVGAYLMYRRHVYKKLPTYSAVFNQQGIDLIDSNNGVTTAMMHSRSPSDTSTYFPTGLSPQPQTTYPSFQGSFSPPPPTDPSIYTTRPGRTSSAIPQV